MKKKTAALLLICAILFALASCNPKPAPVTSAEDTSAPESTAEQTSENTTAPKTDEPTDTDTSAPPEDTTISPVTSAPETEPKPDTSSPETEPKPETSAPETEPDTSEQTSTQPRETSAPETEPPADTSTSEQKSVGTMNARELYEYSKILQSEWKSYISTASVKVDGSGMGQTYSTSNKQIDKKSDYGMSTVIYESEDDGKIYESSGLWQCKNEGYFFKDGTKLSQKALSDKDAEYLYNSYFGMETEDIPDVFGVFVNSTLSKTSDGYRIVFSEPTQEFYEYIGMFDIGFDIKPKVATATFDFDSEGNITKIEMYALVSEDMYIMKIEGTATVTIDYTSINKEVEITPPSDSADYTGVKNIVNVLDYTNALDGFMTSFGYIGKGGFASERKVSVTTPTGSYNEQSKETAAYIYDEMTEKYSMSSAANRNLNGTDSSYRIYFDGKTFKAEADGQPTDAFDGQDDYYARDYIKNLASPFYGYITDTEQIKESITNGVYTVEFDILRTQYADNEMIWLIDKYLENDITETYINTNIEKFSGKASMDAEGRIISVMYTITGTVADSSGINYSVDYTFSCYDIEYENVIVDTDF